MACNSIRQITFDACSNNLGGVKNVWLANYVEDAATVTATGDVEIEGTVSGFAEGVVWQKYPMKKNSCSYTSTINNNENSSYVSTDLSMSFSKMQTANRIAVQALALGECMAVVEDSNGNMVFLGKDAPLTLTSGSGETGQAKGDANRFAIVLTDESLSLPMFLDETAKEAVKTSKGLS